MCARSLLDLAPRVPFTLSRCAERLARTHHAFVHHIRVSHLPALQTIYAKWPASWALQEASAAKLAKYAKVVQMPRERTTAKRASTLRFSRRAWRGGSIDLLPTRHHTARFWPKAATNAPLWQRKAAATVLQAAFRGFRARRKTTAQHERGAGGITLKQSMNASSDAGVTNGKEDAGSRGSVQKGAIKPSRIPVPRSLEGLPSNIAHEARPSNALAA